MKMFCSINFINLLPFDGISFGQYFLVYTYLYTHPDIYILLSILNLIHILLLRLSSIHHAPFSTHLYTYALFHPHLYTYFNPHLYNTLLHIFNSLNNQCHPAYNNKYFLVLLIFFVFVHILFDFMYLFNFPNLIVIF